MSDADLYISNGACYYGEGSIADTRFIPCGNAAVAGPQSCCFQGDFCLAQGTCYDNDTAVTYITGCTDPTYSAYQCPHKPGYLYQPWVALARCNGDDISLYSGCAHHMNETLIKHEDCKCDAEKAIIVNEIPSVSTLSQVALLPPTAGGIISFNPNSPPTALSSSSDSGSGGLSQSTKIGVGVGIGIGVPLLVGIIAFFLLRYRKKHKTAAAAHQAQEAQQPSHEAQPPADGLSELPPQLHHQAMAEADAGPVDGRHNQRSPPPVYSPDTENAKEGWLRYKPELHADSAYKYELSTEKGDDVVREPSTSYVSPQSTGGHGGGSSVDG
ncbi:hypothetical protein F4778DRAFT_734733 [Xylariomycetidae sp. FL2044]|nr:hypothetical protein F4778DRAFT_734733 [Xylariomycetidae sp. FL2044]